MPRFSIIIPIYNGSKYLSETITSVLDQAFADFELLLVDDFSTDSSLSIANDFAKKDPRISVLAQDENTSTLCCRLRGILESTGQYILLMDQDDELIPDALSNISQVLQDNPVDILHFGVDLVAENSNANEAAVGMLGYLTPSARRLENEDILTAQVSEKDGFDWNVHHKVYRGELARTALMDAKREYLTLSDDLYLSFILASCARSYLALANSPWYVYHLGRGETFGTKTNLESFTSVSKRDAKALDLISDYVSSKQGVIVREDWPDRIRDVYERLAEHVVNEMNDKLDFVFWPEALTTLVSDWPKAILLAELYRLIRDKAYKIVSSRSSDSLADNELNYLVEWVQKEDSTIIDVPTQRYQEMKSSALCHIREIRLCMPFVYRHIALFSTTHKNVDVPQANCIVPVQVGDKKKRFTWAAQDDSGNNISELNPMYCELTTQWWAWKNVNADYYGFCHYRRYFNFSNKNYLENAFGEVMDDFIDWSSSERYGLNDENITRAVEGWDVITSPISDVRRMPGDFRTLREHYSDAPKLNVSDLDRMMAILKEVHPEYSQDVDLFINGHAACFCNMFIMKAQLFNDYCEWLFPLLDLFMNEWDTSLLSKEALRTPGHLAERLLNIYLIHRKRIHPNLRWKQLQCVHFEHPEADCSQLRSLTVSDSYKDVIPIALAADDTYVPMLTTTIESVIRNASPDYYYDIVVLEKNISSKHQQLICEHFSMNKNVSIRFANVVRLINSFDLSTSNEHISIETYYRFLIQWILPDYNKVLYLDSDLIVVGDISDLFAIDLGENLIAAVRDIDFQGNLNMKDGKRMAYAKEVLHLQKPFDYFQAGVLLLNTEGLRSVHTIQEWLTISSDPKYIYNDQDILNAECQGRVVYLDPSWNVMNDCADRVKNVFSFAPAMYFDSYQRSVAHSKIVHYAGFEKPWKPNGCDRDELYWFYARNTPFYESLIESRCGVKSSERNGGYVVHQKAIKDNNPIRKIIDPIMPLGSQRREVAKSVVRKIRGRS